MSSLPILQSRIRRRSAFTSAVAMERVSIREMAATHRSIRVPTSQEEGYQLHPQCSSKKAYDEFDVANR